MYILGIWRFLDYLICLIMEPALGCIDGSDLSAGSDSDLQRLGAWKDMPLAGVTGIWNVRFGLGYMGLTYFGESISSVYSTCTCII